MVTKFKNDIYATQRACKENQIVVGLNIHRYFNDKYQQNGVMIFEGKSQKPCHHNRFKSIEQREKQINHWIQANEISINGALADKLREKQIKDAHTIDIKVNDVLYCSWGYDQTNIDFYKVIGFKGKTLELRELKKSKEYKTDMTGVTMPVDNAFIATPFKKRLQILAQRDNTVLEFVKINSYSRAYKWDGEPMNYSEYA